MRPGCRVHISRSEDLVTSKNCVQYTRSVWHTQREGLSKLCAYVDCLFRYIGIIHFPFQIPL